MTKISKFTQVQTFEQTDLINIVRNSTNYTVPFSAYATALGVTGTIVNTAGGTPVLYQPTATTNIIRSLTSGAGVSVALNSQNGITVKHNFTFDATGASMTNSATVTSPIIRSLVAGTGVSIVASGNTNTIASTAVTTTLLTVTANHTTTGTEDVICNNTTAITVTLDATPVAGDTVNIKRYGSGGVTVSGAIDNLTSISLGTRYDNLTVKYIDASIKWVVL